MDDLQQARLRFAREIQRLGNIKSSALIESLSNVPRVGTGHPSAG